MAIDELSKQDQTSGMVTVQCGNAHEPDFKSTNILVILKHIFGTVQISINADNSFDHEPMLKLESGYAWGVEL
jgi:hypothetical protein